MSAQWRQFQSTQPFMLPAKSESAIVSPALLATYMHLETVAVCGYTWTPAQVTVLYVYRMEQAQ
jgi:hypothetical protein